MTLVELLPWLNVLLLPICGYVITIERRMTRLETRDEDRRAQAPDGSYRHRRASDPQPGRAS